MLLLFRAGYAFRASASESGMPALRAGYAPRCFDGDAV